MKKFQIIFFVLVGILAISACSKTDVTAQGEADHFTLEAISGEKVVLSDVLKYRKAVLVFWATWCPSCREEIPHVEEFYSENKQKVAVIGINIKESKRKVTNFVSKRKMSYPVALDSEGSVARLYNVRGIPTIVAIDKNGKILYRGHSIDEMMSRVSF